jgi:cytochrome P450
VTTTAEPLTYSPYDYVIHEDPYPTYARLRAEAPVFYNEDLDFFAYSRHADVLAAFRDIDHYSNANGVSLDPAAYGPNAHKAMSFLAMDPPRHTRMRSIVGKSFTPSRVAEMEPGIRALAQEHLAPALEAGSFDFVSDFAGLLPMDVISELVGVPRSDRAEIRRLADLLVHRQDGMDDIPPEGIDAALTLAGYYADMVTDRRQHERDDLTWSLLQAEIDGDRLTDDEVISFLFLLVVAGNETTTKLLSNAWYWGWRHPEQGAKPLTDPARVRDWVEETLRYDTSTQMLLRVTSQPVQVQGVDIEAGRRVLLLIGSANRDEAVFEHPERYELDRETKDLISFGGGRHFCMGAALARMETRIALSELTNRVSSYEVDEGGLQRVHSINVRGLAAMPTTVTLR